MVKILDQTRSLYSTESHEPHERSRGGFLSRRPLNFAVRCAMRYLVFIPLCFALGPACANEVPRSRPACTDPAPLYNFDPTALPNIVVTLKDSVEDQKTAISLLEKKYALKFGPHFNFRQYHIEARTLAIVDALRCEPDVESIKYEPDTVVVTRRT